MGLEADCTVRIGRRSSVGRALLETDALIFRGEGAPIRIPLDALGEASIDGDDLVVTSGDREARFSLGAATAERWLRVIREPKGLFEKLEIVPTSRVAVVDVHDPIFLGALRERVAGVAEGRVPEGAPVVFYGAENPEALRRLPLLRARMVPTGILWIVRPKGGRGLSESDVMEAIRSNGLVDVKVVAFSRTHTAHKCVIPLELRGLPVRPPPIVSIPPSAPLLPFKARPKAAPATPKPKRAAPARPRPKPVEAERVSKKKDEDQGKREGKKDKKRKKDKKEKRKGKKK